MNVLYRQVSGIARGESEQERTNKNGRTLCSPVAIPLCWFLLLYQRTAYSEKRDGRVSAASGLRKV